MKKLITIILISVSFTCIAQHKDKVENDTVSVQLSKWQLETIADIQKKQQEVQEAAAILSDKYKLIIMSSVDNQGIEFEKITDVYIKNGKLFILKKKEPLAIDKTKPVTKNDH